MKKFMILLAAALFILNSVNAKIWRVNNNPGVVADFTTAQEANDAATVLAGDTIHLEPSISDYGILTTNKKLVWLSIGYFLTQNPGNQFSTTPGTISYLQVNTGSEGSVFSVVCSNYVYVYANSVTFLRSTFGTFIALYGNNESVNQCWASTYIATQSASSTNNIITNNICASLDMIDGSSAIITNNIVLDQPSRTMYNSVFQNNILAGGTSLTFSNSNVSYNMCSVAALLPGGNNNLQNIDMSTVFQNYQGTSSVDKDLQLKPGSPAIGAGFGGIDMGAFGGTSPFVLAMQPAIPAITGLSFPGATGSNTIQVTFSAKSNN